MHNGTKENVCQQCGKTCILRNSLFPQKLCNNINLHTDIRLHICGEYDKAFKNKWNLREHEKIHRAEKFPYEFYEKIIQIRNLHRYKKEMHYNKRNNCNNCLNGFKTDQDLYNHLVMEHSDVDGRLYKCETCLATFVRFDHLKRHSKIHTGEKPYVCKICAKAFTKKYHRDKHCLIHSNKKPYDCSVCGKGYSTRLSLFIHIKNKGHK